MKTYWTIPVERIKTVKCIYCDATGDVDWAGNHLAEKKYYLLPESKRKSKYPSHQFNVIEKVAN